MECYICYKLIRRHKYTRHIGSHLAGNDIGRRPGPDAPPAGFGYDTDNGYCQNTACPAPSTPPSFRAPTLLSEHSSPLYPAIPNDQLQSNDRGDPLVHLDPVDSRLGVHFPSFRFPAHPAVAHEHASQQETSGRQLLQPNAFHLWLQNPAHESPGYTTVDGRESKSDLQTDESIQSAVILRDTTREEVIKIMEAYEGLSDSHEKTCSELIRKVPIFPGLVAYTYTHLVMCPRRGWFDKDDWSDQVSHLRRMVECWEQDGDAHCILSCDTIKERLLEFLRKTKVEKHKCNPGLLNETVVLKHDIRNLAALAVLYITGPEKDGILDQHGSEAERLVELFHELLEANVELGNWYRRCFLNALIMFSKRTGYCPRGVYLTGDAINDLVPGAQGGFGYVYQGRIGSRLVAVKAIKRGDEARWLEYKKDLSKEAIIWKYLRHPNCLPFYGIYNMPASGPDISLALVSPWMDQGTLLEHLERDPKANRTRLILDVVRGLNYLHSMQPHVAHRDIKPDNILITKKGHACLADFGLVSTFDIDDHFRTATSQIAMGGTFHYMAPEIFHAEDAEAKRRVNKRACDMYALGSTIYAVYMGRPFFCEMHPMQLCADVMFNRQPVLEGTISPDMWSFVENLWDLVPSKRLTAEMALHWMEEKARQEGVDLTPAPFEEEWEWEGPHDDKCLWSALL